MTALRVPELPASNATKLDALLGESEHDLSTWSLEFCCAMRERVDASRSLTDGQQEKLDELYQEYVG